ncbi:hypothetical protein RRG08_038720 [Elysia crispata]|uniref:Uncharacterized protein n=1 Tax=Elysia crispata TaxID=231223 RepID=A0AAE0ZIS6_9GAST|nr:hypothetical protein RRG08_038720 [Elysia crispata]
MGIPCAGDANANWLARSSRGPALLGWPQGHSGGTVIGCATVLIERWTSSGRCASAPSSDVHMWISRQSRTIEDVGMGVLLYYEGGV